MDSEKRLATRFPVEKLPEDIKGITFKKKGFFAHEHRATLLDASNYGMSFSAEIDPEEVQVGQTVYVNFFSSSGKLKAKVVYTEVISDNKIKIGVTFSKHLLLEKYHSLLLKASTN